jgi:hypothetical protein
VLETIMELKHILDTLKRSSRRDFESIESDSKKLLAITPDNCDDTRTLFEETSIQKATVRRFPNGLVKVCNKWRGSDWFNSLN